MTSRTGRLRLRGAKPRGEVAGEGPWSCGGSLRSRHRRGGPWHTPTCTGRARALLCRAGRPLGAGAWPGLRNPPYLGCWASSAGCPRPRPCPSPSGTCYPWCQRQSGPYGRLPGRGRRPSSSLSPLGQHEACGLPGASVAGPAVGGGAGVECPLRAGWAGLVFLLQNQCLGGDVVLGSGGQGVPAWTQGRLRPERRVARPAPGPRSAPCLSALEGWPDGGFGCPGRGAQSSHVWAV